MTRDLVIIGGGPGGYTAAIRAAQLGASVTLIEEEKVGGTCLNRGCIPTKTFYKNAQIVHTLKSAGKFGLELSAYSLNMQRMQEEKNKIVGQLVGGIEKLLKAHGIEVVFGRASFIDSKTVSVRKRNGESFDLAAEKFLIATGSVPFMPPIPGLDLPGVMTSEDILEIDRIPSSMVIIGGGVIGIEFAGIFNAMGTAVTVLELMPMILPTFDGEIVKRLAMSLKRRGIRIETGVKVEEIKQNGAGLCIIAQGIKDRMALDVDSVLVSTGRKVNTDGLNLEKIGVAFDKNGIEINNGYMTSVPGIYAIGDVTGGQMLAHVAAEEGKAAVEDMMGLKGYVNYKCIPACVFTFPETAGVGLNEKEALEQGIPIITSKFLFGANGKALTMREGEGLVKVICRKDNGELLGVHIMGPHASDLIHEGALAVENRLTAEAVGRTVHAHPTLSEAFLEAVLGLENKAIHMYQKK